MGSEFFNKIQYGKEDPLAHGDAVAATKMFIGQMPAINPDTKPTFPVEHFGLRSESYRGVIHQYLNQNTLSTEHGAFQHIPLLMGGGLKGAITPVEQNAGQGDYLWDATPSMTSIDAVDSFTLRVGDDVQAYVSEYCEFERIRISGNISQGSEASPVKIEADYFGRQLTPGSFTGGLTPPTMEPMNAKLARFYLDNAWADVGETELANLLRTFDIEILTGRKPKFAGSTAKTYNRTGGGIIAVMGTIGIEAGSDAVSIFAAQRAGTFKVGRLTIDGSQIGSGDNYNLTVDFGGLFEDAKPISGADRGDNLATFVLHDYYDKTAGKKMQMTCTTNSNAY